MLLDSFKGPTMSEPDMEKKPLLSRQETEPSTIQYYYPSISYQTTGAISEDSSISTSQLAVYKKRWWIIFVFSICSMAQSAQWNAWSPISDAVEIAFSWKDTFVTTIPAVSNAGFILMAFPTMYVVETRGTYVLLRNSYLLSNDWFSSFFLLSRFESWNVF